MKKKPSGTLSISTLRNKIRMVRGEIAASENAFYEMDQRLTALRVKLQTYLELLQDLTPEAAEVESVSGKRVTSITEAAIDYVAAHPGAKPSDVVNALAAMVQTDAADPKKSFYQTLLNLRNRGRIERTPEGGLKVAGNGAAPTR